MISKELARKIQAIKIFTSHAANSVLAGEYESVFKGRGMAFEELRQYQVGDDIRTIDWNVTARTGVPYVRIYAEERELIIFFLVDVSASGAFGSSRQTKHEVAAELCALLAFSAVKNNDKVGLLLFTDRVEKSIPPGKGTTHVLRILRETLDFSPQGTGTDLDGALQYLGRVTTKPCVVFLLSDFFTEGFENSLRVLGKRHDVIPISIRDPREIAMPNVGLLQLEDAETGRRIEIDTRDSRVRQRYERLAADHMGSLNTLFQSMGMDHLNIINGGDYVSDLIRFFRKREKRRFPHTGAAYRQ
jgi:uncharacterized protein (DUF58 family)